MPPDGAACRFQRGGILRKGRGGQQGGAGLCRPHQPEDKVCCTVAAQDMRCGHGFVHCQLCPQSAAEGVRVAVCGGKRGGDGLCHPLRQPQRADIGRKVQRVLSVLRPVTGPVAAMYKLHHKIPRITSPSASASRLSAYIMRSARRISSGSMGRTASPMVGFL